jgi:hypothetical protein
MTYSLYIMSTNEPSRKVRGSSGLTLDEAQEACRDTQTSSRTADSRKPTYPGVNVRALNKRHPEGWFVGYSQDR